MSFLRAVSVVAAVAAGSGWFAFQPAKDDFKPTALDMSGFVEAPTGAHGFLTTRGEKFVFADGTPARFWGAQVNLFPKEQIDYAVRRMRRQGINITRLHGLEFLSTRGAASIFDYDPVSYDRLDYLIARLGENGIYLILDVDYPLILRFGPGDSIPGLPQGGPAPHAEFIDERVASLLHRRMADVFTHLNPYTKKRYADDPTVAMVEILNEDSLFWGDVAEPWRGELERKFGGKLLGNTEFSEARLGEDPEKRRLARKQMRFFLELEERYWRASRAALRRAGVKVPISATNWQGHGGITTRVHMLGQSKMDYIDRHGYWDHPQGEGNLKWRIATARFHDLPMIQALDPSQNELVYLGVENLVTEKAWERVLGLPMTISEWNTCLPNEYSLEGTGLMAAYGLMQGWSGSLEFGYFSPDWRERLGGGSFDLFGNPPQILQFPAAAAMWHRGDVAEGELVAESLYALQDVFELKDDRKPLPIAAALVGKVGYRFPGTQREPVVKDLRPFWDPKERRARSTTGELSWDASHGIVHVDTARTQAAIGFLGAQRQRLADTELESPIRFGAVWVTAIDGAARIRSARRLLITAVGPARGTGMEYEQTREKSRLGLLWRLREEGSGPALVEAVSGQLRIRSEHASKLKAWVLDVVGHRGAEIPLARESGAVVLTMTAEQRAVYYELAAE